VKRHDCDSAIHVTEFDVATPLAALFKADLAENPNGVRSLDDRGAGLTQTGSVLQ
jgi:hypothetical protein